MSVPNRARAAARGAVARLTDLLGDAKGRDLELDSKILVGTHHKTGTVWLLGIFSKVSRHFRLKFFAGDQRAIPDDFDVFFQNHSHFRLAELPGPYRGLHMIRDPRDVIISGCFYHQKASEPWLHVKRAEFGGLTYQEKINSYSSADDRIAFEMEHAAMKGIRDMLCWDYSNPAFLNVKYEDLIEDRDLVLFHRIFTFLGFPGSGIPKVLEIAYANSLFSGNVNRAHVRSGQAEQWRQHLNPRNRARFLELFGGALVELGYEGCDDWIRA